MKLSKYGLFTTVAASLFFASQASAALVIDNFNNPAGPNINSAEDITDENNVFDRLDGAGSTFAGAGILGGERDLYVELLQQGTSAANGVEINVDSGSLSYATGDGDIASASIQYDGLDGIAETVDTTGLGAVDFAAAGNAFILDVLSADASFNFAINLWSNAGAVFEQVVLSSGPTQIVSPVSLAVSFANFTLIDFTSISALEFIINTDGASGPVSIDFSIDALTVPEPASIALLGVGLLGIGYMRRRKTQV
ncbi:PEP-CTERM sorting domain-containing protein [Parasalinivibrio latis]|uniref:PEP-CTERM sorting domain-containing protein n=1 Tax=Parasalinivibrio latis TaxID=2952610 RepID=UPI0030DEAE92